MISDREGADQIELASLFSSDSPSSISQQLVDCVPHELWVMDAEARYLLQNRASVRSWGSLIGRSVHDVDAPERSIRRWAASDRIALQGEHVMSQFTHCGTRCVTVLTPLRAAGTVTGIVGVNMLEYGVQVARGRERAHAESTRSLDRRGVAHDLNNSFMTISGVIEMASSEADDREMRRKFMWIRHEIERCAVLARRMSAPEPEPLQPAPLDLGELVHQRLESIGRTLAPQVELRIDAELDVRVVATRSDVERILMNLVLNAAQAIEGPGEVKVSVRAAERSGLPDHQMALLSVEDDGTGIPRDELPRLFSPLHTTRADGSGLGLWNVRNLVDAMGGAIRVCSRSGSGTRFQVFLPTA